MASKLSRVPCEGGVQIAVHHFGGDGPSLIVLAANGFMPQAYLPLVKQMLLRLPVELVNSPVDRLKLVPGHPTDGQLHLLWH